MSGKGGSRRPLGVSQKQFAKNWDNVRWPSDDHIRDGYLRESLLEELPRPAKVLVDECDMGGAVGLAIDNGLIGKGKQRLGVRISPREAADLAKRISQLEPGSEVNALYPMGDPAQARDPAPVVIRCHIIPAL